MPSLAMSASDACPIGHVSINVSGVGDGLYYGYALSTALFGITIVQAWNYLNANTDGWLMRSLVVFLVAMDAAVTGVNTQILHHYLIDNFGNTDQMEIIIHSFDAEIMMTAVVVLIVELFFVVRIYKLNSENWLVPAVIRWEVLVSLCSISEHYSLFWMQSGSCTAFVVAQIQDDNFAGLSKKDRVGTISAFNGSAALADILITIALSWNLSQNRSAISRTNNVIQKMLTYIINRGLLVTVVQTLTLIMYSVEQTDLHCVRMPTHLCINKIYVITMLAILNTRPALREQLNSAVADSLVFNSTSTPSNSRFPVVRSQVGNDVDISDLGLREQTIEFSQAHGSNDQLHDGSYGKAAGAGIVATMPGDLEER
ncbi:uncharacterized protein BT62DRAFT_1013063 [Guyanagaster necrorhizus]|uniref:DUF6534 domain-containing protein n=1 Tax=Guyanagaster necrorhizus TaxID=856835 RepID=A0A9P7VGK5_9AGAR|nr:uncharacterized protein BT62DRAFT_1013063 [Guyanagaster necrorhizus MCA 3950]KAG7440155.1 hypothetical protein BT62DRAFT_1013063 [Guyanagaster necrorhizus MCA 3950]